MSNTNYFIKICIKPFTKNYIQVIIISQKGATSPSPPPPKKNIVSKFFLLGADFKNNQTTKQENNSIWTNRKQVKFCFYLPIGPNKFFFNCLFVWLFLKSAPSLIIIHILFKSIDLKKQSTIKQQQQFFTFRPYYLLHSLINL